MTPPRRVPGRPLGRPHPAADDQDLDARIVLYVPDVEDRQTRVLDAAGRAWRRRIGFGPPGEESR